MGDFPPLGLLGLVTIGGTSAAALGDLPLPGSTLNDLIFLNGDSEAGDSDGNEEIDANNPFFLASLLFGVFTDDVAGKADLSSLALFDSSFNRRLCSRLALFSSLWVVGGFGGRRRGCGSVRKRTS